MAWLLFFVKQKTSYEMRISDWSSDVCSSDLELGVLRQHAHAERLLPAVAAALAHQRVDEHALGRVDHLAAFAAAALLGGAGLDRQSVASGKSVSTSRSRWSPYHTKKTNKKGQQKRRSSITTKDTH